jgi:hypothetical protein
MRFAIVELDKNKNIDTEKIGTFGFSGSGFTQVLFAMNDYRIKQLLTLKVAFTWIVLPVYTSTNWVIDANPLDQLPAKPSGVGVEGGSKFELGLALSFHNLLLLQALRVAT